MQLPGLDIAGAVVDAGKFLIDRFIPDPQKKAEAELELYKYKEDNEQKWYDRLQQSDENQTTVNATEAQSDNVFKSGWRPFVGWTCGVGFALQYAVFPLGIWIASFFDKVIQAPTLDTTSLMTLLFGLLGLGTLRTYEKIKGTVK